jgi:hypothetical protein
MQAWVGKLAALILLIFWSGVSAAQETPASLLPEAQPLPTTQTTVEVGAYILRIDSLSPRTGTFNVDMWLWFRWTGADARPCETFELPRGIITGRIPVQVLQDQGMNYATLRAQATLCHQFDVRRFALDDHTILIEFKDASFAEA